MTEPVPTRVLPVLLAALAVVSLAAAGAAAFATDSDETTVSPAVAAPNEPFLTRLDRKTAVAAALLPTRREEPGADLSAREREVLELVAEGLANKQIAKRLGIAERTVKVHLGSVFRRIGVTDRTSAALWAREHLS